MNVDESVSRWIANLREGDDESTERLWQRYFSRLVRLAGSRLPRHVRRDFDEEDVALSAFASLCRGVERGRFPDLADRHNLWSLLVVITARKSAHQLRDAQAQKRGRGKTRGESVFGRDDGDRIGLEAIIGHEPSPEFAAEVAEASEVLLAALPDEGMRRIAALRLEGYATSEIATRIGCGLRTVERRLNLIRQIWSERDAE